jgi:hypothetical protein
VDTQLVKGPSALAWFLPSLLIILAIFLLPPADAASPNSSAMSQNKVPGQVESTARRLANGLRQQGYEVQRGYFKLYTEDDCPDSYEVLRSCLGNNPAAPYVIPVVPAWPDEWLDPGTAGLVGPTVKGYNASYRLDPREAIVILGVLPPPARYFGLQTYLLSRPGEWEEGSDQYKFIAENVSSLLGTFFTKLPHNQERLQLFADLSNSINNVLIANRASPGWDELRYFVITPDQTMDGVIRQALGALGVADEHVLTEPIPSDMIIGLDKAADDFLSVIRYAMPDDRGEAGTRSSAWRERLPLVVLRIRDARPALAPQPYPPVEFEPRSGTVPPETALQPDLTALADAVCYRWGPPCEFMPLLNMWTELLLTGPECVAVGMNCLAPTEDTAYFMSKRLPLDDATVYAVLGTLGTETGNATYVGLGLNDSLTQMGFDNIDDGMLAGSASALGVPNHERLYLQYFARDCERIKSLTEGSDCYAIGDKLPYCDDPDDPSCSVLVLSVRNYLFPGSQRGPDPELTQRPVVIRLQRGP